ncbi:hypothetical protein LTR36_007864 [Oleoguttula mirabilis]|uniref:Uncharacterized protein n=1 Tax=Oleoguttula mirabilis TaxID=1507867 RepID=A0AAV9J900_9PEZI|nr:hypothetical protein LTR36_007864 [Oleoguttula mirabilis]
MDDHSFQQELEALAGNAYNPDPLDTSGKPEPISATMARWQKLFHLSPDEAVDRIMDHRNNLTRTRVSDAHWDTVRSEKEAEGYDREAFEYELEVQKKKAQLPDLVPAAEGDAGNRVTYLVELSGRLDTLEKVQQAACLEVMPEVVAGRSVEEGRAVQLCCINGTAKTAILRWASKEGGGFEPTILVDPRSLR